jgi:hypothetical protein
MFCKASSCEEEKPEAAVVAAGSPNWVLGYVAGIAAAGATLGAAIAASSTAVGARRAGSEWPVVAKGAATPAVTWTDAIGDATPPGTAVT